MALRAAFLFFLLFPVSLLANCTISFDPANPLVGQSIKLVAKISSDVPGPSSDFLWDFGDGVVQPGVGLPVMSSSNHIYTDPGNYKVTFYFTDSLGIRRSCQKDITVIGTPEVPPVFDFGVSIPEAAINVDGSSDDWSGLEPVVTDPQGDGSSGKDIASLYLAMDDMFLYWRIDLYGATGVSLEGLSMDFFTGEGNNSYRVGLRVVKGTLFEGGVEKCEIFRWGKDGEKEEEPLFQTKDFIASSEILEGKIPLAAFAPEKYTFLKVSFYGDDVTLKSYMPLSISPKCVYASPGEEVEFSLSGGSGSYIWESTGGNVTFRNDTLVFEGNEEGVFYLWVTDGREMAYGCVNTVLEGRISELVVIPSRLILREGESYRLSIVGYKSDGTWVDVDTPDSVDVSPSGIVEFENSKIIAKSVGKAKVKIGYQGVETTIEIEVKESPKVLIVEPPSISLEKGKTAGLKVFEVTPGGDKVDITVDSEVYPEDPEIVDIKPSKVVVAKKPGITRIFVSYGGASTKVPVTVSPVKPFEISPKDAVLELGDTVVFTIYGGTPPYRFNVRNGSVRWEKGRCIYTPNITGEDVLIVEDSQGNIASANILVLRPLTLTPSEVSVTTEESVVFRVDGGSGNYTWAVTQGTLNSTHGREVLYTPPREIGEQTITVMDSYGYQAEAYIWVGKNLVVSPGFSFISPGDKVKLTILGGKSPFQISITAGSYVKSGDRSIIYTAPEVVGSYVISVQDSISNKAQAEIRVRLPLMVTPQKATVAPGDTIDFSATGGVGDIVWEASRGVLSSLKGDRVRWKAPENIGPARIVVRDASDNVEVVEVDVISQDMAVVPSISHVKPGDEASFFVVGGVGPYTWRVEAGDISLAKEGGIIYKAPKVRGSYRIEVIDSSGNSAEGLVYVYSEALRLTPNNLYVRENNIGSLKIFGGVGNYTAWANLGKVEIVSESSLEYTPPSGYEGADTIFVMDGAGNVAKCHVEILSREDVFSIYAGPDGVPDDGEMEMAIKDFTSGDLWLTMDVMYKLIEKYLEEK